MFVKRPAWSAAAALAVVVILSACSGPLDVDGLEADLEGSVLPEYPDLVTEVRCPRPFEPAPFEVVRCDALISGAPVVIAVTVGESDQVVSANLEARLVDVVTIERLVAERFVADLGLTTTVTCGAPVVVVPADGAIGCTAIDPRGTERPLTISVGVDDTLSVSLS